MPQEETLYKTSDTPTAAYLISIGFVMLRIEYNDKAFFVFQNGDPALGEAIRNFRINQAQGNVPEYEKARRDLVERVKRRSQ